MSTLLSGLLAGGWPFLVGWVFPSALAVALFSLLTRFGGWDVGLFTSLTQLSVGKEALVIVALAVALGLFLSTLQTFLYRILEGYVLIPRWLRTRLVDRQLQKREVLRRKQEELENEADRPGGEIECGFGMNRLRRYPIDDNEIAATRLGNAIRAFETYGWHRFRLDLQAFWGELVTVLPDEARQEEKRARSGVDFFVALTYLLALLGVATLLLAVTAERNHALLAIAVPVLFSLSWAAYRLAVMATDYWYVSVQAMVNLGRLPLAQAMNLSLPESIEEERKMWETLGAIACYAYDPKSSRYFQRFAKHVERPETLRVSTGQTGRKVGSPVVGELPADGSEAVPSARGARRASAAE